MSQPGCAAPQRASHGSAGKQLKGFAAPVEWEQTWQQLVVIRNAKEQREVVAHVAALRVDEDVPEAEGNLWLSPLSPSHPTRRAGHDGHSPAQTDAGLGSGPFCCLASSPATRGRHGTESPGRGCRRRRAPHHLYEPTSKTLLRSSLLLISEKFSIFHVNFPYRSIGDGEPAAGRRMSMPEHAKEVGCAPQAWARNDRLAPSSSSAHGPASSKSSGPARKRPPAEPAPSAECVA